MCLGKKGHPTTTTTAKMKHCQHSFLALAVSVICFATSSVVAQVDTPSEASGVAIDYTDGDTALLGHLATPSGDGPFPAIVIVP